MKYGKNWFEPI